MPTLTVEELKRRLAGGLREKRAELAALRTAALRGLAELDRCEAMLDQAERWGANLDLLPPGHPCALPAPFAADVAAFAIAASRAWGAD